jgi:hypothetical protein
MGFSMRIMIAAILSGTGYLLCHILYVLIIPVMVTYSIDQRLVWDMPLRTHFIYHSYQDIINPAKTLQTNLQIKHPAIATITTHNKLNGHLHTIITAQVPLAVLHMPHGELRIITDQKQLLENSWYQPAVYEKIPALYCSQSFPNSVALYEFIAHTNPIIYKNFTLYWHDENTIVCQENNNLYTLIITSLTHYTEDIAKAITYVLHDLPTHQKNKIITQPILDLRFSDQIIATSSLPIKTYEKL